MGKGKPKHKYRYEPIEGSRAAGILPKDKTGRIRLDKVPGGIIRDDIGLELLTGWKDTGKILTPPNNHKAEQDYNIRPRIKGSKSGY